MKIEPGYWRTRRGDKAQVLAVDVQGIEGGYSCVGVLSGTAETWTECGHYRGYQYTPHPHDLIEPWREPATEDRVVWLLRFNDGDTATITRNASEGPPQFHTAIGSTRVTVTEGVFA